MSKPEGFFDSPEEAIAHYQAETGHNITMDMIVWAEDIEAWGIKDSVFTCDSCGCYFYEEDELESLDNGDFCHLHNCADENYSAWDEPYEEYDD